jgi:hypothetical protein
MGVGVMVVARVITYVYNTERGIYKHLAVN